MKLLSTISAVGIAACIVCSCSSRRTGESAESSQCDITNDSTLTIMVGSYSNPGDTALRIYSLNIADNNAVEIAALPVDNASYFTQSSDGIIYAVTETDSVGSKITAIHINGSGSEPQIIGSRSVGSDSPCYITVSPDGRFIVTADYGGATASVFPITERGEIGELSQRIVFSGNGPVASRQEQSHPHCIAFTPDSRFMLVDDLGTDKIHMFPVDSVNLLNPDQMFDIDIKPGSGPRHIVFNKKGNLAYLINEISDSVTVLSYDGMTLIPIQYIAANTVNARGAGDIHISPDGRHLYASLRLENEGIATFDIDSDTGLLSYKEHTPVPGHPRNFMITPDGSRMLVACRDTDEVRIYTIDADSGLLTDTGRSINVSKPVCVKAIRL